MKRKMIPLLVAVLFGAPGAALAADTNVVLYGHLDASVDAVDNGVTGRLGAQGNNGWLSGISSNLSRIGVRGSRDVGTGLKAVFQIETQIDLTATPGNNTGTADGTVNGAFAARNSFIGLAGSFGAFKLGKTDAPYKLTTLRMDPFSATLGDWNSIIGNTGGDNRAEFDTRVAHAAWYESPNMSGFMASVLWSPGQNRSNDNINKANGQPNCTGGNPPPCTDGSFGTLYSGAATYSNGPFYGVLGYELHQSVNRTGDEGGATGGLPPPGSVGVADERAWHIGVQYKLANTTINALWEDMRRSAPNGQFNERSRNGFSLSGTQKITAMDDINLGWTHAGSTPGDPGGVFRPGGANPLTGGLGVAGLSDNKADMYAIGYKHHFADKMTTWYLVYAEMHNGNGAHYDLGASGHGLVVDCHDQNGNCFSGAKIRALTTGITYSF